MSAPTVKHTPGPWRVDTNEHDITARGVAVAAVYGTFDPDKRTVAANARLVAAAPELAEALRDIMGNQLTGNVDLDAPRFVRARTLLASLRK